MHRIRRSEGSPTVSSAPDEADAKAPAAERARHDTFVTGAVDCDRRGGAATAVVEVALRATQIPQPFLAGCGDELNWPTGRQPNAIDLLGDREHHRESAAVVVDAWTNESVAVTPNAQRCSPRKHRIEMRADHDGCQWASSRSATDDIARFVDLNVVEPERAKS